MEPSVRKSKKKLNKSWIVVAALVVLLGGASIYYFAQYQHLKSNPQAVSNQETNALISQVGKLIDLPKSETPTIATVNDKSKLKGQAFFVNVQDGDKILIYTTAQKAIIFRPSEDRLINVGPIAISSSSQSTK
jgi:uncharacterized membrane protein